MPRVQGRKAAGVFLRSENAEAGSHKTAMRFMRDYTSRKGARNAGGKLQLVFRLTRELFYIFRL